MDIGVVEQANALIEASRTPVIIIPKQPSSDALASGLALLLVLEKLGKTARVVSPEFSLPASHSFLPKSDAIEQDLANLQSFVVSVSLKNTKLESLSYTIEGDDLHIYLTPKQGFFRASDIRTSAGGYAYDLIILLDAASLEQLGPVYEQNAEFFYHTPILNIDHHPANRRFGHVNLVDVAASSVSEIVFELVKRLGIEHLNEQVATSLLTGIISKTKAFQSNAVTPRSLAIASHLVSSGARRDEIIRNLFQTKNLQTLKLWGRALTRLQAAADQRVIWSSVLRQDLAELKASPKDAAGVLDELMVNAPNANFTCLFIEVPDGTDVYLTLSTDAPTIKLPSEFVPSGPLFYQAHFINPLADVTHLVLTALGVTNHQAPRPRQPNKSRRPETT